MIRSRSRPRPKISRGPSVSHDAHDKLIACLYWWVARDKSDPDYVKAPHYFDAILAWHDALSLDDEERCATVHEVYVRPGWRERFAKQYADALPPVPKAPASFTD
jgi:hypothetical protein